MQGLSAIAEVMLYCTQALLFASVVTCGLQPFIRSRRLWSAAQSRRAILIEGCGGAPIALLWCGRW